MQIPLPGGSTLGISLLIILLIPTGIYFTIRTRFLPIRLFPDMVQALVEKKQDKNSLSSFQTLIVSTATRVGMGNLVGVVAAISAGGAGAIFWMWVTAIIGSSTAFIEATLAQLYKEKDPLYGGYRGGPAYYIHSYVEEKQKKKRNKVVISVLFAISGLICWCGISQVISNSVVSSFKNAFSIPPIYTTVVLVAVAAVIVLRKDATVKILDMVVPVMAVCYFAITIGTGPRGICRYDRDLQLHGIYHAACTGRESCRTFRNGSSADSYGTSSWEVWRDLYCGNAVFI